MTNYLVIIKATVNAYSDDDALDIARLALEDHGLVVKDIFTDKVSEVVVRKDKL